MLDENIITKDGLIKRDCNKYKYYYIFNSNCCICKSKNNKGVNTKNRFVCASMKYKIMYDVNKEIDYWKFDRIIWIGFVKNEDNKDCLLSSLPKDVIIKILKLTRI